MCIWPTSAWVRLLSFRSTYDQTAQAAVKEQQVYTILSLVDAKAALAACEGKVAAQFE
jgi:hypothetical protein